MPSRSITHIQAATPAASLLISCEHGGNRIPAPYRQLFSQYNSMLESHRGFDQGALTMARALAKYFGAQLLTSTTSRLLVDLNRSLGHRHLHMEAIRMLPVTIRQEIIDRHYLPYRIEVERQIACGIDQVGRVIHISCHSFTPNLNGQVRGGDICLLYDPARKGERTLCANWKSALEDYAPSFNVRRNYPYRGCNDGLTTAMRDTFTADTYLGIELELNQKQLPAAPGQWRALRMSVINSLDTVLRGCHP